MVAALMEAEKARRWEIFDLLREAAEFIGSFPSPHAGYRPEEAIKALERMRSSPEYAELPDLMLADLRNGVAWLTRVIEEAERTHGQED